MQTTNKTTGSSGYSMPGTVTSIACVSLLVAGSCFLFPKHGSLKAGVPCPSLTTDGQNTYAVLSQDIRAAHSIERFEPDQLVLAAPQGEVTYTFDSAGRTLTRTAAGETQKLLTGVDSFSFSLLRRAAAGAPIGTLIPASPDNAKAVACRWSCSRKLTGAKLDSETFQMAPVLIRNRSSLQEVALAGFYRGNSTRADRRLRLTKFCGPFLKLPNDRIRGKRRPYRTDLSEWRLRNL